MLANSSPDIGHSCDQDQRRNDMKPFLDKWNGEWDKTAELMMPYLDSESCHPIFRATCALGGGELRSKGKGKKSFHSNDGEETIELILRTIVSVNHISIYRAVADLCKELSDDSEVAGKPAGNEDPESNEIPY